MGTISRTREERRARADLVGRMGRRQWVPSACTMPIEEVRRISREYAYGEHMEKRKEQRDGSVEVRSLISL